MKIIICVLMLSSVVSSGVLAQGLTPDEQTSVQRSYQEALARAARRQAQEEAEQAEAKRQADASAAEQERQRQAYDLQLRNQQETQKLQSKAHAEELKQQDAQIRRGAWDRLVDDLHKQSVALWNIALRDANNMDYSLQTRDSARSAMKRLSEEQKVMYSITPNFADQTSYRAGIAQLPSPELGYNAEYSAAYLKREAKKTQKSSSH